MYFLGIRFLFNYGYLGGVCLGIGYLDLIYCVLVVNWNCIYLDYGFIGSFWIKFWCFVGLWMWKCELVIDNYVEFVFVM